LVARIADAGGESLDDAEPLFDLAQQQHAAIGGQQATVEIGDDRLAADR
jgi:hypothetical protein